MPTDEMRFCGPLEATDMDRGLVAAIVVLAAVTGTHAQVRRVTVTVRGMSCPFCAFGLEKKLRAVAGVDRVHVTLKTGQAELEAAGDHSIDLVAIPKAIGKAGFSPGAMRAEVSGIVRRAKGGLRLTLPGGSGMFRVVPGDEDVARALEKAVDSMQRVTLQATVTREARAAPVLRVTTIEPES